MLFLNKVEEKSTDIFYKVFIVWSSLLSVFDACGFLVMLLVLLEFQLMVVARSIQGFLVTGRRFVKYSNFLALLRAFFGRKGGRKGGIVAEKYRKNIPGLLSSYRVIVGNVHNILQREGNRYFWVYSSYLYYTYFFMYRCAHHF